MGAYVKKTARRRYDERQFTVRAVHRDPPDLHKLCEALIRARLREAVARRNEPQVDRQGAREYVEVHS